MEYGDYTIPAGWLLLVMLAFTNRMPEYFVAPETFDPERFLAPREEDKRTPYAWIGFGSGAHTCLGMGKIPCSRMRAGWCGEYTTRGGGVQFVWYRRAAGRGSRTRQRALQRSNNLLFETANVPSG